MTLYNLADYRARRLRSRAVPLHVEALAAYEQAEAYRARHLASAHVCGWGESSESDGPAAAPPWPPASTLVPSSQPTPEGNARTRRVRPCRRAADERDELAAPCMSGKEHCEG